MTFDERPTRVRHLVVAAAALMSVLLYLDRFCISFAEVYIQQDLNLTKKQVSWMLSAFFWTYALGQVPAGWLTDRFGSRIMLTVYVLSWSLFTALTGAATGFAVLLGLRFGFGFAQAGAYPTASSIVSRWVPLRRRGTASGIISSGGRLGGFLALFATGYMIVWLTPSDVDPSLQPADVRAPLDLCRKLSRADRPQTPLERLQRKCFEQFSSQDQERVRQLAGLSIPDRGLRESTPDGTGAYAEDLVMLANELNGLIAERGLFTREDVRGVAVEREAVRLLREDSNALTDRQVGRLNRLVIEGAFPDCIGRLYVAGWRPMMFVYGGVGVLVAALIWWSCHTTPSDHHRCNAAEIALVDGDRPRPTAHGPAPGVPLRALLTSTSMWSSCLCQWFTNIGWAFLLTWAPRYMMTVHHLSVETRAVLVSMPLLIGWSGMLLGGRMTDWAVETWGLRWGRVLPITLSRFAAMLAYVGCLFDPSPVMAAAMFSLVAFATDFGTPSMWAFTQDVGGRNVGSVLGWGNMWGNLGAAVTPPLLIWIIGPTENWDYAFQACAGAFLLSGLFALGIDATIPIAPDENAEVCES